MSKAKAFAVPKHRIDFHNHLFGDPDGTKLLEVMDACGIDKTLIMGLPTEGLAVPMSTNEQIVSTWREYPNRFIPGVYIDPRDGQKAIDEVHRYHAEGVRIVKLFPNYGYFPDDEAYRPFFAAVAERKMAVLSHCGWLAAKPGVPCAAYYSYPGRFEKVIRLHRETIFIMAHMGGIPGYLETVMLTTRTPNTYVDCSPGQGTLVLEKAGPIVGAVPPEKLLFGADSYDVANLIARNAKALKKLGYGPHLDKIFYGNARGILEKLGLVPAEKPAAQ